MENIKPEISVVVPIWNDIESLDPFLNAILPLLEQSSSSFEIIFSVDPSKDGTAQKIQLAALSDSRIKALFFASRSGQPASTLAGLRHAKGIATIIIDVDLQDPVELIPQMISSWRAGNHHILPRRVSRTGEPISKRVTAAIGYLFLDKFGSVPIPRNTGDFRLIDHSIVERVLTLRESHVFLRGLIALVDQHPHFIEFERPARKHGKTKYIKWFGGLKSGLNGIVSYSTALLDWLIVVGALLAVVAFFFGAKYAAYKLTGHYITPGNTQLFVMVTFIGGMQLVGLGILGLYIGRIFEEVKSRPRWHIQAAMGIEEIDLNDSARRAPFIQENK